MPPLAACCAHLEKGCAPAEDCRGLSRTSSIASGVALDTQRTIKYASNFLADLTTPNVHWTHENPAQTRTGQIQTPSSTNAVRLVRFPECVALRAQFPCSFWDEGHVAVHLRQPPVNLSANVWLRGLAQTFSTRAACWFQKSTSLARCTETTAAHTNTFADLSGKPRRVLTIGNARSISGVDLRRGPLRAAPTPRKAGA